MRCWNRLEYTVRSIISISELSGLDRSEYEILCVDQNSTDGTREWLKHAYSEGYYSVVPVLLEENVGDGLGMNYGIKVAEGEFICQHDSDCELVTPNYYKHLIDLYEALEKEGHKICALGGSHKQGLEIDSAPFRFGRQRYGDRNFIHLSGKEVNKGSDVYLFTRIYMAAWVTASFIFRKKFGEELEFGKGMCNSWCGHFWDLGYTNFICESIKFYHIDSGETGAHIQKQYDKFPSYSYIFRHYRNFIKKQD